MGEIFKAEEMKHRYAVVMDDLSRVGGAENLAVWMFLSCREKLDIQFYYRRRLDEIWPEDFISSAKVQSYLLPSYLDRSLVRFGTQAMIYGYGFCLKRKLEKNRVTHVLSLSPYTSYIISEARRQGGSFVHTWYCHEPSRSAYFQATDRYLCEAVEAGRQVGPELEDYYNNRLKRIHSSKNKKIRRRTEKTLSEIDNILTNSYYTSRSVLQAFQRKSTPLYLGIPLPDYQERQEKADTNNSNAYIGILAPKRPEKNLYNVIDAFLRLKKEKKISCSLRIAGAGNTQTSSYLKEMCNEEKAGDSVSLEGFLTEKERCRFIDQSLFMAYLPVDEPFGIVPLEVLARKKPVVISNHGGMSEVLQADKECLKVDPIDQNEISAAFLCYINDISLRNEHAQNGYIKVSRNHSLEGLEKRLIAYFESQ